MAYATYNDVIARYNPIKTMIGANSFAVASLDVASVYIWQSEALIDAYIGNRYSVPLGVVNPLITQIACDLSIFYMLAERVATVPDFMQKRYDRSIELLTMISSGTLFVNSATIITSGDNYAWSPNMEYHPIFSPVLRPEEQYADTNRIEADECLRDSDTQFT